MNLGDNYQADRDILERLTTPERMNPQKVDEFLNALRTLLYDSAGKDLRIAQVIGNLGDNYYMEDDEYVALVWEACG